MTVTIENATFRYTTGPTDLPTDHGVRDITFTAEPGSVTVLCGPSGCGKSTILRLLNGLAPHFHSGVLAGSVTVDDLDVPSAPLHAAAGRTATVFQNPRTQFFTPTVLGELAFCPENLGLDPADIRRRIADAARATGIGDLLGRHLAGLSGGELQRVACACSLTAGAPTLLFDEPTANLSPAAIDRLRTVIADLREAGHTIIIAEHRLHFLAGLADRVLLMENGRITRRFSGPEFFRMPELERRQAGLRRLRPTNTVSPPAPPPGAPGIHLRDVTFRRGRVTVLDLSDVTFPAGKVTALTGPNGIGKTTLSRLVCGLLDPTSGTITRDGTPLPGSRRRREGYIVLQDTSRQLFAESVAEEITLGLPRQRRTGIDVDAVLADFDLTGLGDRHPLSLSGGQRQRLVVATATLQNARVLVFDEPTSGVGLGHLETIARHLRALAAAGAVVIVVTHDDELIDACADHRIDLADPALNRAAPGALHPLPERTRP